MSRKQVYNRVKEVFRKLRKHNLVCRMNHLCCMTCASHDLGIKCDERGKDGAVYFHNQDYDSFWNGYYGRDAELHIRYFVNKDDATDTESAALGHLIHETLVVEGLTVEWSGDPGKTIVVKVLETEK